MGMGLDVRDFTPLFEQLQNSCGRHWGMLAPLKKATQSDIQVCELRSWSETK